MRVLIALGGSIHEEPIAEVAALKIKSVLDENGIFNKVYKIIDLVKDISICDSFDIVYIVSYGSLGENGSFQSMLQEHDIPYTGCISSVASICRDKYLFGKICSTLGILTPKTFKIDSIMDVESFIKIVDDLEMRFPLVVKPRFNSGSSKGVIKIESKKEIKKCLDEAFLVDSHLIVQNYIEGVDYIVGVMSADKIKVLPIGKAKINKDVNFSNRYKSGNTIFEIGNNTPILEEKINSIARKISTFFEVSGIVYIDFRVASYGTYFIELGTMFGVSDNSIVPITSREIGIDLIDLIEFDINQGLSREGKKAWSITKKHST